MKNYQYFFFDLDGTLLSGNRLIPYAKELIRELEQRGKQIYFLTNHPVRSRDMLSTDLIKMGLAVSKQQLITPTLAWKSI